MAEIDRHEGKYAGRDEGEEAAGERNRKAEGARDVSTGVRGLFREAGQEVEVLVEDGDAVEQDQHADEDDEDTRRDRDELHVGAHLLEQGGAGAERGPGDQEGNPETDGIEDEEEGRLSDGAGVRGQGQDAGEDGPDAGRPADRERTTHEDRACVAPEATSPHRGVDGRKCVAELGRAHEEGDRDQLSQMQAQDDQRCPGDTLEPNDVVLQRNADQAKGGAQDHEDDREAGDEGHGVQERRATRRRELVKAASGLSGCHLSILMRRQISVVTSRNRRH